MIENLPELATVALQEVSNWEANQDTANAAAALAVGLSALAAGYAERGIGAAAVGAIAEDSDNFVPGLIMTVLPETLVIFALVVVFVI